MSNIHIPPSGGQSLPSSSPSSSSSPPVEEDSVEPAAPPVLPAQFAIRSDGVVLMSTAEAEALGRDLTGRTVWTGIELALDEFALLRARAFDTEQEVAAKLTAQLPRKPWGDA